MPPLLPSMAWLAKISPFPRIPAANTGSHASLDRCLTDYSMPTRIIYDHELILYRDCTCVLELEEDEIVCSPDSFIIIPPGVWHSEICQKSRHGYRYWCHFDWTFQGKPESPVATFALHRPRYELCHPVPDFVPQKLFQGKIPNPKIAYAYGERLRDLTVNKTPHEMLLAGTVLHALLVELLDSPQAPSESSSDRTQSRALASRIRSVLDCTALSRCRSRKVSSLFAGFKYSYEHLCRLFRQTYGVSPLQYLQRRQISKAKMLLRKSDLNISEICSAIGMNSPAYFTKLFRRLIGKTPSEYKREWYRA